MMPWVLLVFSASPLILLMYFMVQDFRSLRRNAEVEPSPAPEPRTSSQTVDLGDDPLDPHGDGTVREGDPMYDLMMRSMQDDTAMFANRREDGTWDVEHH